MEELKYLQEKLEELKDNVNSIGMEFDYQLQKESEKIEEVEIEIKQHIAKLTTFNMGKQADVTTVQEAVQHFYNSSKVKDEQYFHLTKTSDIQSKKPS